jgi:hypothetical protein
VGGGGRKGRYASGRVVDALRAFDVPGQHIVRVLSGADPGAEGPLLEPTVEMLPAVVSAVPHRARTANHAVRVVPGRVGSWP